VLKYRLITAFVVIPILFLAIWYLPSSYFALFMAGFIGLSAWEWAGLIGCSETYLRALYIIVVLLGLYFSQFLPMLPILSVGVLAWLWAAVAVFQFNQGAKPCGFQFPVVQAFFGFLVLVTCWLSLIYLRQGLDKFGAIRLLLGLMFIFAMDTGAYFSGRLWGRHTLVFKVSPKKTWEGFLGGLMFTLIIVVVSSLFFPMSIGQRVAFWCLGMLVAVFSVVGDLTVSLLKRQTNVKDSGQLLPGHGGILDRIDSIASGILVFTLGLVFFGSI